MSELVSNGIVLDETQEHADKRNMERSFQKMDEARAMAEQRADSHYRALQVANIKAEVLEREVNRLHDLIARIARKEE